MASLSFCKTSKTYPGGVTAIHGVNMEIADGEFIVIVGPSGCGKSTLLRMVAGLESVSAGEILIDEEVINELEPAERDIAMVFQNYALYPHMSVYDNMAYGLRIRGMRRDAIRERVEAVAQTLELTPLLTRRPRHLSGGQRQRVAMGRAIVREPRVFLFDEPLSNLDAKLRVQMRLEIQKLHRRLATTSLYVTHDQVEAMTLAQRMIVMNQGRVEQIGTPAEVFERPASTFVASFIGAPPMNLMTVQVGRQGGIQTPDGIPLHIAPGAVPQAVRGQEVVLGTRPEHLVMNGHGVGMTVEMVETLGSEQLLHGHFGATRLVVRCNTRLTAEAQNQVGDVVEIGLEDGRHPLHWFDLQSGRRIEA
ncbi:Glycerol-3-phosphate ABC transporter, ATP-binding protein UgpC (TC 3.A.1.1.3) [plant metagenome]|uniref:Glycerol-3-phosphate ABC transporter, ATP-binding protein UgpC (TC 3.A.1.1.3) n=1 Tax=plant metagenome TaxID=1297885 RepID=A0A484TK28_9ZZZZ